MLKRIATILLMALLAGVFLTSCGGSKPKTTTATGSLTTLVGDSPGVCDAISFPITISDLSLVGPDGAGTTPINSSKGNQPLIKINLACLRDSSTVLNISSANVGTYNIGYVSFIEPTLLFYDPTILPPSPPINTPNFTLIPKTNIQVPIDPPLVIIKGAASALQVDFDMLHMIQSITTDPATGNLVVTGAPEITLTPVTAAGSQGQGFGVLDDLTGFVRSVSVPPPVSTTVYDGSFSLQVLGASPTSAPNIPIYLNSSSQLYGFTNLNQLLTDSFMEVDAYIDVDGNFVATSVENEYVEYVPPLTNATGQAVLALIGPVTSLTRNSSGNVTSFNLWARDVEPNDLYAVTEDSIPVVTLSTSTTYQYSSRSVNFANLPFGPSNISVGQEVIAHGTVTPPTTGNTGSGAPALPTTMNAMKVYDKLQSIQGSFSSLVQVAADGKTGAFTFTPCGVMFQGTPGMVLTNSQTSFVNLTGLSSLAGQTGNPTLVVKGLPFFEVQAQTIMGVPVPAGTLVILAKQVHKVQ
jgi:hypothetical protein